jgi:hypothetical protein
MEEFKSRLMRLFISRRFLVFATSTVLLFLNKITADIYLWITGLVLGSSSLDKFKDVIGKK